MRCARVFLPLLFLAGFVGPAFAHTDRWAFSDFTFEEKRITFTLRTTIRDMGDVVRIDKNGDGDVTKEELESGTADILGYINSHVQVTLNGRPVQAKMAGIDPPQGFDPPWPILSIDKIWFVVNVTYDCPSAIRDVTIGSRLFDAIPHLLNKGKMVRGDDESPWLFDNGEYKAVFKDVTEAGGGAAAAPATPTAPPTTPSPTAAPATSPPPGSAPVSSPPAQAIAAAGPSSATAASPSPVPSTAPPSSPPVAPSGRDAPPTRPTAPTPAPVAPAPTSPPVTAATPSAGPAPAVDAASSLAGGARHGLKPDHALFVIGLALLAGSFAAFARVLLFYLGMTLAGLLVGGGGLIGVSPDLSEATFALMLACLGVENLFLKRGGGDGRWLIPGLGALHGAGMGSAAAGIGSGLVAGGAWIAVTLGVGLAAFALFSAVPREGRFYRVALAGAGSMLIAGVGLVLFVERAGAF